MKTFIILLSFTVFANISHAQVMQKRTNTSTTTKSITQPAANNQVKMEKRANTPEANNQFIKPITNSGKRPTLLAVRKNPNMSSIIKKMIAYSKTITYPDNSKIKINLHVNPSWAGQATTVNPSISNSSSSNNGNMVCTTSTVSLSATSTDFMNNNYSAQTTHIYPGAIYTFDHLFDGSFREETANRNPIIIGTDNPNINGSTYETVTSPNQTTIHDALSKLRNRFRGPAVNESISYQMYEAANSSDLNIKVGAAGSGYGASFSNVFDVSNQETHLYLTIDARKTLFSIGTPAPDSGYFKNNANASAPMAIMGSVSYGVRILANLEYTFKSKTEADAFIGNYNGFGVSAHVDLNALANNTAAATTVNAYVIGGPSSDTKIAFNTPDLETQVNNILSDVSYQNAEPVSYELFDMQGNVIGEESATDKFVVNKCVPAGNLQNPHVTFLSADDGKDDDTHYTLQLFTRNDNNLIATFSDNSDNDEYPPNTQRDIDMQVMAAKIGGNITQITPETFTQENFMNQNGGRLHLTIQPNGHDTWKIGKLTLTLSFGVDQETISWSNVIVSQNSPNVDLYFDNAFNPLH